jgi:UDP-2-acetamido-3-amino-2,3-dideoxy-glucuronate N-acetyltransferase
MPVKSDVRLGSGVVIFHPELVNLYGCRIGDGTRIGAFVEIQKNALIGKNCKISSHSFICEGVEIEDEVFIGHGVKFINDLYPHATTAEGKLQGEADWTVLRTLARHAVQHRCRRELRKGSDSPAGQDHNLWPGRLRNIHCEI